MWAPLCPGPCGRPVQGPRAPPAPRWRLGVAAAVALRAHSLGAMSELLLTLRRAPERRAEMLRKEDGKGLKAICAGLGRPSGGTPEEALQRIQEALKMEDELYQGVTARVIEAEKRERSMENS